MAKNIARLTETMLIRAVEVRGYIGTITDTPQQSEQTPDKEVGINQITLYVGGYTETDPTIMLSPNNGRLYGANKVGLFRADSLVRHLLQCAKDWCVAGIDKTYLIEHVTDVTALWDQRDKNYHNRDLKPKLLG